MKKEKIEVYGTFGPACKSQEVLEKMVRMGMTGMRLNLSHTTLEKSKEYLDNYKLACQNCGVEPQILIDMQGPELRIGKMEEQLLKTGDSVVFIQDDPTENTGAVSVCLSLVENERINIPVPTEVINALEVGMEVLLDDGKIKALVKEVNTNFIMAEIMVG